MRIYKLVLILSAVIMLIASCNTHHEGRKIAVLHDDWKFTREDAVESYLTNYPDSNWQTVTIPHDWAIAGPFDMTIDIQNVKVLEDGDSVSFIRTGRTGALPFIGVGWYRKHFSGDNFKAGRCYSFEFDGAMSHAQVYINGQLAAERPYGYSSFNVDMNPYIEYGKDVTVAVRLENFEQSSRWYPGAGLYRNVRLVETPSIHIAHWGTFITTPEVSKKQALVNIKTTVKGGDATVITTIYAPTGKEVASASINTTNGEAQQVLKVTEPQLWDINSPNLYTAVSEIRVNGTPIDNYKTVFGIRSINFDKDKGFFINGRHEKINGVCLHHDLGPLGAAVNRRGIERQIELLKEMGCNAIRTAHNPAAPELLELCDEMGILVMEESFDEWRRKKNRNGYSQYFDEWAEKDLTDMIRRDRNHPCIILWSIGNEVREQAHKNGSETAQFLTDICHREDPTRLTTMGSNEIDRALKNGFASAVDIMGANYKPHLYQSIKAKRPEICLIGAETASTVSSRGIYYFPAKILVFDPNKEITNLSHKDYHCSAFDIEYPKWASTPDMEFTAQDSCDFIAGEFVWTGFDYLGEPTPYIASSSSRSSYFGILDLAGMKKDRFYLYQSRWSKSPVLHLLPHWNWEGHEGEKFSVHCYTNYDKVELFINGKSFGVKSRSEIDKYGRYRRIWHEVPYSPGELKAVAYDSNGKTIAEEIIKTAGKPAELILHPDRKTIRADGQDISFIEITITDENGIICPTADNELNVTVKGCGSLIALCNGDPTSLEPFSGNTMKAFNGKCIAIVGKTSVSGNILVKVSSEGLTNVQTEITVK